MRRVHAGYHEEHNALPEPPAPLLPNDTPTVPPPAPRIPTRRIRFTPHETPIDSFGRYRIYPSKPLTIPDSNCALDDFCDEDSTPSTNTTPSSMSLREAIAPCPNLSTFYFLYWFWKGSNKSKASREELRTNVILNAKFIPCDLDGVNLLALDEKLAEASYVHPGNPSFPKSDGWTEKKVSIQVPILGKGRASRLPSHQYISVPGMSILLINF
jgi:hypothetical protein